MSHPRTAQKNYRYGLYALLITHIKIARLWFYFICISFRCRMIKLYKFGWTRQNHNKIKMVIKTSHKKTFSASNLNNLCLCAYLELLALTQRSVKYQMFDWQPRHQGQCRIDSHSHMPQQILDLRSQSTVWPRLTHTFRWDISHMYCGCIKQA